MGRRVALERSDRPVYSGCGHVRTDASSLPPLMMRHPAKRPFCTVCCNVGGSVLRTGGCAEQSRFGSVHLSVHAEGVRQRGVAPCTYLQLCNTGARAAADTARLTASAGVIAQHATATAADSADMGHSM
jgi:hypothetical protein